MLPEEETQKIKKEIAEMKVQKSGLELQQVATMPRHHQLVRRREIKRLELAIKMKDELINGMD